LKVLIPVTRTPLTGPERVFAITDSGAEDARRGTNGAAMSDDIIELTNVRRVMRIQVLPAEISAISSAGLGGKASPRHATCPSGRLSTSLWR
jgi:hypothetical protein